MILFVDVPVAPRDPFQFALLGPLFELRHEAPALPPLFKLPQTQAARTPDATGLQLKPAPTPYNPIFYLQIKQGYATPLASQFTPLFTPLTQVHQGTRTSTRCPAHCSNRGTKRQHRRRSSRRPRPKRPERQTPPESS